MNCSEPDYWADPLAHHTAYNLAAGTSRHTLRMRGSYLRRLAAAHPDVSPWSLTMDELVAWLAHEGWSAETRKSARGALRSFYSWSYATGRCPADPSAGLPRVRVPRGQPRPTPHEVVLQAFSRADRRERLMLHLALLQGMRRAEIARTHTADRDGDVLRVRGKGGNVRRVPLHPWVLDEMTWRRAGYLFPGPQGHLSPDRVGRILGDLLGPGWTAHTLRHAAATAWYEATGDLAAVQELLGHASPETTRIYTAVPLDHLRRAVNAVPPTAA